MQVCPADGAACCKTVGLDGAGNEFRTGDTNTFAGAEITDCENFRIADAEVIRKISILKGNFSELKVVYVLSMTSNSCPVLTLRTFLKHVQSFHSQIKHVYYTSV